MSSASGRHAGLLTQSHMCRNRTPRWIGSNPLGCRRRHLCEHRHLWQDVIYVSWPGSPHGAQRTAGRDVNPTAEVHRKARPGFRASARRRAAGLRPGYRPSSMQRTSSMRDVIYASCRVVRMARSRMRGRDVNLTAEVRRKARPGFRASASKCAETLACIRATSSHLWQRTSSKKKASSMGGAAPMENPRVARMARSGYGVGTSISRQAFAERLAPDFGSPRASARRRCVRATGRHLWMSNDIYEIFAIYVSSVAGTTHRGQPGRPK